MKCNYRKEKRYTSRIYENQNSPSFARTAWHPLAELLQYASEICLSTLASSRAPSSSNVPFWARADVPARIRTRELFIPAEDPFIIYKSVWKGVRGAVTGLQPWNDSGNINTSVAC